MATLAEFESLGSIIRNHFPNGCPKCGTKRFKVEVEPQEKMEWMGRGLIETGKVKIRLTCQNCGHVEEILIP